MGLLKANCNDELFEAASRTLADFHPSVNCLCHASILSMRPIIDRVVGVSTFCVRLGHLFESSRFHDKFIAEIDALVEEATFREMVAFRPQAFHAKARATIEMTRPSQDLDHEAEEFILGFLNYDWDQPELRHIHVHGQCGCGGRARFRANVRKALHLLLGGGCAPCLLARWKGFERAVCWCYRAFQVHALLPTILARISGRNDVAAAEEQAAQAAIRGEINYAANTTVRLGKAADFCRHEDAQRRLALGIVLNAPQQRYLNGCFKAYLT